MATRPRILIYSHDTYGLGHLRRSLLVASRLAARPEAPQVLIVTGSARAHSFEYPRGCDAVKMPSIVKGADGHYHPRNLDLPLAEVLKLRSSLILETIRGFRPDIVLVDHAPAGVEGELLPVFAAARALPHRPRFVLGLRDVIDHPDRVRAEWNRLGVWALLDEVYDRVLVYGDRSVLTTADELLLPELYPGKVAFTGYLARTLRRGAGRAENGMPRVLVTTGGGGDGHGLLRAYAAFLEDRRTPASFVSTIVTGPFLSKRRRNELVQRLESTGHPLEIIGFTDRLEELMTSSSAVIGMAGYNTAVEVLSASVPALFIPRDTPRLEQTIRAERLARAAGIEWCPAAACTPARVGAFLERAFAEPRGSRRHGVDLGGLDRLATELDETLMPTTSAIR